MTEEENVLFLTDPRSKIVNVEVERESKSVVQDNLNCKYCHSNPCRNGSHLFLFKQEFIGIIVKYVGKDDKLSGKTGFVDYYVNGDLLVRWLEDGSRIKIPMFHHPDETKPDIDFQFQFSCDKSLVGIHEEMFGVIQPTQKDFSAPNKIELNYGCPNCHSNPCRSGQYLLHLLDVYEGMTLQYVGTVYGEIPYKSSISVKGVKNGYITVFEVKRKGLFLVHKIEDRGEIQFMFNCHGIVKPIQNLVIANQEDSLEKDLYSFRRLPARMKDKIEHEEDGEKHCIVFSVDTNIQMRGVGLQLVTAPDKIIFTLLLKNDQSESQPWNKTVANQAFMNLEGQTEMLMLNKHINLEKGSEYLVMLSYYGGKSYFAGGGKNILDVKTNKGAIITFSFKDYEGKADANTNVLGGVFGKFLFKVIE